MISKRKQKYLKRRNFELKFLLALIVLLMFLTHLYVYLLSKEKSISYSQTISHVFGQYGPIKKFSKGDYVLVKNNKSLKEKARKNIGYILSYYFDENTDNYVYTVQISEKEVLENIPENQLKQEKPLFFLNEGVGYKIQDDFEDEGKIVYIYKEKGQLFYEVDFRVLGLKTEILSSELIKFYEIPLSSDSASENNIILQDTMQLSKKYSYTKIFFPSGDFPIGSYEPEKDYLILSSNIELIGNKTNLIVDGFARWFGLATGPDAIDGLSNFKMLELNIEAKNLLQGNQFIIMANHGNNWEIRNNNFTMVHKISSHIFDLGGVQNVTFENNSFIGYAPELTDVTSLEGRNTHDFYSEAIQIDTSDGTKPWDGDLIKNIDSNYVKNNPNRIISHNVFIINNKFLPYTSKKGELIAKSATIGQHSTEVGYVQIYGNYFQTLLVNNIISPPSGEEFLFRPVHVQSFYEIINFNNVNQE